MFKYIPNRRFNTFPDILQFEEEKFDGKRTRELISQQKVKTYQLYEHYEIVKDMRNNQ